MALEKQTITLPFGGGLDQKTDDKLSPPNILLEAENVYYDKTGLLQKRNGYSKNTQTVLGGTTIASGAALTTFGNELLEYSNTNLYAYSENEVEWIDKGHISTSLSKQVPVHALSTGRFFRTRYATYNNISVVVSSCADTTGLSSVHVMDNTTNTVLYIHSLPTRQTGVGVGNVGNRFFVFYVDTGILSFKYIDSANPSVLSSAVAVGTIGASVYPFTITSTPSYVYVLWTSSTGKISAAYIDSAATVSSPITVYATNGGNTGLSIKAESSGNIRINYTDVTVPGVGTVLYNSGLTAQLHSPTFFFLTMDVTYSSTLLDPLNANKSYIIASGTLVATSTKQRVMVSTITSTGVVSAESTILYGVELFSTLQTNNNNIYFVGFKRNGASDVNLFKTYYLFDTNGNIISKWEPENGLANNNSPDDGLVPLLVEGNELCFTGAVPSEFNPLPTVLSANTIVKKYCADFTTASNYFDTQIANNLHINGGIMSMYDGNKLSEHNFLEIPDKPTGSWAASGLPGPGSSAGVHPTPVQYCLVFAYRDMNGQLHRSAPSEVLTVSATATNGTITVTYRPCTITSKADSEIEIEIYRTEGAGTVFYKVSGRTFNDKIFNNRTLGTATYIDTMDDSTLISGEVLYTTGGILENNAADSSKYSVFHKNRIFTVSADGTYLQYSKLIQPGNPVSFNTSLRIDLNSEGGRATCLASLDDYLIIFKEDAVFGLVGNGPNDLGQLNDYENPFRIHTDVGCAELNSLVRTPEGIFFKSKKGIYVLKRGLTISYVGQDVHDFNSYTITSATLIPDTTHIRMTLNQDKLILFDYFHKKWLSFTNINAVDSVIYNEKYVYVRADGTVHTETHNLFTDDSTFIPIKVVTAWYQFGGQQGYQRLYKLLLLGSYESAHKLRISAAYNYDDTYVDTVQFNADTIMAQSTYGSSTPYGAESTYGGPTSLYQWEFRPQIQKCNSIKLKIEDAKRDVNGSSLTLSGLAAEIGIKKGANKRGPNYRFGLS